MTRRKKIELLRKAQEKLLRVIEIIEKVFPDDEEVGAYLIPRLKIAASDKHDFVTDALNIDKLIRRIKGERRQERVEMEEEIEKPKLKKLKNSRKRKKK